MPWIGLDTVSGHYVGINPPTFGLNRARRHRLDVDNPRHRQWLFPGGELNLRFTARTHEGGELQQVEVTYRCVSVPQQQGHSFRFAKYYFSNSHRYQWLNVRCCHHFPENWAPSNTTFDVWL